MKNHEHVKELNKEYNYVNETYELLNYELYQPSTFNLKLFTVVFYIVYFMFYM
jgi:hypothetical protein